MSNGERKLAIVLRGLIRLGRGERLYGVLDGARDATLATEALSMRMQVRSLFIGPTAPYMNDVAPYVVEIDPEGSYLENWARRWGTSTGILLACEDEFDLMWDRLRDLFIAEDEDGQELFFRYYDPRVLREYLPTCTAADASEFFGPIRCVLVEAEGPGRALICAPTDAGVSMAPFPVPAIETPEPEGEEA